MVPAGGAAIIVHPPIGFTATDIAINVTIAGGVESGWTNYEDPPGNAGIDSLSVDILCALDNSPIYAYVRVDDQVFGPVHATVPIASNGSEPNGVPRLFKAVTDPITGDPIPNPGPGHCFTPTNQRINDPITGAILPEFAIGPASVCASFDLLFEQPIPTVSAWGLVVLTLLMMTGAKIYFARRQPATG